MRYLFIALLILICTGCATEKSSQETVDREIKKVTSEEKEISSSEKNQIIFEPLSIPKETSSDQEEITFEPMPLLEESTSEQTYFQDSTEEDYWQDTSYEDEGLLYDPNGPDVDCPDFPSHYEAQEFYIAAGGPAYDPHRLDRDNDGYACEMN